MTLKRVGFWFSSAWERLRSWLRPARSKREQQQAKRGQSGKVFVYGTLRRGQPDYHLLEAKVTEVEEATIPGLLYYLEDGTRAVTAGVGRVSGQLLTFADVFDAVKLLDELAGYDPLRKDNFYQRRQLLATTIDGEKHTCDVYVCPDEKGAWLAKHADLIPSSWTRWEPGEQLIAYYAYGSCMSLQDFKRTVPDFDVMGMAELTGYQVAFTRYANSRQGGVADIVQVKGKVMEGVLYLFPKRYLKALDKREGVPSRVYERVEVRVRYDGMKVPVWTYTVVQKAEQEIPPSQKYRDIIMEGAEELLSEGYTRQLREKMDQLMEQGK